MKQTITIEINGIDVNDWEEYSKTT